MSLTLSTTLAFHWQGRLLEERATRNLTELHLKVGNTLCQLLEAGEDRPTQGELAIACRCSLTAVKDALRRLRQLAMLGSEAQYVSYGGRRRQLASRYWLTLPEAPAVPRPEIRRHRAGGVRLPKEERKILPGWALQTSAQLAAVRAGMEARLLLSKRRPP